MNEFRLIQYGIFKGLKSSHPNPVEYLISTVPLGGYVKMLGENDDDTEDLPPDEERRAFHNQHVLKRMAIVAAGPVFNLVLAAVLFCGLFLVSGKHEMTTEIGQVREGSPADAAGLKKGDLIISIQGESVQSWSNIKKRVHDKAGIPCIITVKRGDEFLSVTVTPEEGVVKNILGEDVKSALIGIVAAGKFEEVRLGPFQAIKEGLLRTWEVMSLVFQGRLGPLIHEVMPLHEARRAHEMLEAGAVFGKLVLAP